MAIITTAALGSATQAGGKNDFVRAERQHNARAVPRGKPSKTETTTTTTSTTTVPVTTTTVPVPTTTIPVTTTTIPAPTTTVPAPTTTLPVPTTTVPVPTTTVPVPTTTVPVTTTTVPVTTTTVPVTTTTSTVPPTTTTSSTVPPTTTTTTTTTTTIPVTTTTVPTTTTTIPPVDPDPDATTEGKLNVLVHAKAAFDPWTSSTNPSTWAFMRAKYDAMVVYSPYFDAKLANYDGDAFGYIDLYAIRADRPEDTTAADHPDWILRTASGDPVYIPFACGGTAGCPQYAGDLGNPAFRNAFVARVGALVSKGYPGVMIDDVNLIRRFSDIRGVDAAPMNPRTGAPMTLSEWRLDVVTLLDRVRAEFPAARIMHNSIWFADTPNLDNHNVDRQIRAADVLMLERGATDLGLTGGTGSYSYSKFIQFIDRVHALGTDVLLLDETAVTEREQIFNLATGLLVSNGNDYISTEDYSRMAPPALWSGFDTNLGDAVGNRVNANGIWRRDFVDGIVVVNEPSNGVRTVQLGGQFRTAGGAVVTQVVLNAREAVILTRL